MDLSVFEGEYGWDDIEEALDEFCSFLSDKVPPPKIEKSDDQGHRI